MKIFIFIWVFTIGISDVIGEGGRFDDRCSSSKPCDSSLWLECIDDKCRCPHRKHWNESTIVPDLSTPGTCVSIEGAPCNVYTGDRGRPKGPPHELCTQNAECFVIYSEFWSKCVCGYRYRGNDAGLCRASIDTPCVYNPEDPREDDCATFLGLRCSPERAICECSDQENMIWDKGVCRILVGGPCGASTPRVQCRAGSHCNKDGVCECDARFGVQTKERKCFVDYGGDCNWWECKFGLYCSTGPGFPSSQFMGTCGCERDEGQRYNTTLGECRIDVGVRCGTGLNTNCVDNARCLFGLCTCIKNFKPSPDNSSCVETDKSQFE